MSSLTNRRSPAVTGFLILAGMAFGFLAGFALRKPETKEVPSLKEVLTEADQFGLGNVRVRHMLDYAESLDAGKLEKALDQALTQNKYGRINQLVQILYAKWVTLDLDAALEHAKGQSGEDAQRVSLGAVLQLWAEKEPMKAWQWFEENGNQLQITFVGHSILTKIARNDPQKALTLFAKSTVYRHDSPALIYATWALSDPAAAAKRIEKEKNIRYRAEAIQKIITIWAEQDQEAAWQWTKNLPRKNERYRSMETIVSLLALRGFDHIKTLIQEFPRGKPRQSAINAAVSGLALTDPEKAFHFVKENYSLSSGSVSLGMIFARWSTKDPEKAFTVARDELEPGQRKNSAMHTIINAVAGQDIDRAVEMLEELGLDSNFTVAASAIAWSLANLDLKRATIWVESMPAGEMKKSALNELMSAWLVEAPQKAAAYALAAAETDPSKELLRRTLSRWNYEDAVAAVHWAYEHLEEADQRSLLPSSVGRWAEEDLVTAAAWVETREKSS